MGLCGGGMGWKRLKRWAAKFVILTPIGGLVKGKSRLYAVHMAFVAVIYY